MRAGRLRHRLTIQSAAEVKNLDGEAVKTWTAVATVWGSVEPMTGKELFNAQQVQAQVTHKVMIRGRDLRPSWRVTLGAHTFQIDYVLDRDLRGIEVTAYAQEVAAA